MNDQFVTASQAKQLVSDAEMEEIIGGAPRCYQPPKPIQICTPYGCEDYYLPPLCT